jgi:hypothetical protein
MMDDKERSVAAHDRLVTKDGNQFTLYTWLFQVGGYGSPCAVKFNQESGGNDGSAGCVDVDIYHDGDFPKSDVQTTLHFCSALQFIRFGLDVFEAQEKYESGDPALVERDTLIEFRDRLNKLAAEKGD